ncbi:hypothetical protein Dimus_021320 [Dionaea muscipula]
MLGVLCARSPKPWILNSLSFYHHHLHAAASSSSSSPRHHFEIDDRWRRQQGMITAAAASVWHKNLILPAAAGGEDWRRDYLLPAFLHHHHHHHDQKGEGSWNVAWDARPARWLHRLDFGWLLFGVCACLAPTFDWSELNPAAVSGQEEEEKKKKKNVVIELAENGEVLRDETPHPEDDCSSNYRVTGVPADGRCLFRAIAHGACLQSGEEAPDENRQRELADELRAKVVEELLKRRKETEWFIEGDFDAYVERIQQPFVWGGEPELLMAGHVLKTPISVYMKDRISGTLMKIANYGDEYQKDKESPINVLFHGYGHYDILETPLSHPCS